MRHHIPGTTLFDGSRRRRVSRSTACASRSTAQQTARPSSRTRTPTARKYGLTQEQREAVRERNVLKLIAAGGNVYYLAKLAGIFGLNVQDIGAQQTGMTVDAFKAKLAAAGR